jgi:hypothetical protein
MLPNLRGASGNCSRSDMLFLLTNGPEVTAVAVTKLLPTAAPFDHAVTKQNSDLARHQSDMLARGLQTKVQSGVVVAENSRKTTLSPVLVSPSPSISR